MCKVESIAPALQDRCHDTARALWFATQLARRRRVFDRSGNLVAHMNVCCFHEDQDCTASVMRARMSQVTPHCSDPDTAKIQHQSPCAKALEIRRRQEMKTNTGSASHPQGKHAHLLGTQVKNCPQFVSKFARAVTRRAPRGYTDRRISRFGFDKPSARLVGTSNHSLAPRPNGVTDGFIRLRRCHTRLLSNQTKGV